MAIWKEIRKALNSTLGTANFKPLDKLIQDYVKSGIKTYVNSTVDTNFFKTLDDLYQYNFVTSDNIYKTFSFAPEASQTPSVGSIYKSPFSITFGASGIVKISQEANIKPNSSGQSTYIVMSKNGNITSPDAEGLITLEHSYNSFDGESNKVNVDVAKGDTLYFYIYRKGTSAGAA